MFGYSLDSILEWTNAFYIFSLAITLALSFALWRVSAKSGQIKDETLAKYKQDAQIQISNANATAALANDNAAIANKRAAELEVKAAETQLLAEDARADAAKAHEKTEELRKKNLTLESKVEEERRSRMELEQAVSPRIMEQYKSSGALKTLTGVTAIISSIPDLESQKMARQLATTLSMAGWKYQFAPYDPKEVYSDGVVIEKNVGAIPKEDIAPKAAELLLSQLKINKIESRTMPATDLPPNTIVVKIGFKPNTFFSDKMNQGENIRVHGNIIMSPR